MKTWLKTVAGLLKTRDEAQCTINDLINCGVQHDAITLRSGDVEHHVWSEEEETDIEKGKSDEGQVNAQQEVASPESRGNGNKTKIHVGRGDIGTLTELGMPESDARFYSEGIGRGGYLLTVVVDNDRAQETAEIIRRHGAVEDEYGDFRRGRGWTPEAVSLEHPVRPRLYPENEPLSHATLSEQLQRAEVFKDKEEVSSDISGQYVQQFVGEEVSLPSSNIFRQHDILQFEAQQREIISGMDDEEFQRHFRATHGERGERFEEPYRSAYQFAEAESSSRPQLVDKEWYEVEEEIHRDWEISHPGTWNKVENAIHFGWDKTRRHH